MNIVIIEDELPAQAKLEEMLKVLVPQVRIMAKLGSVAESLEWLGKHPSPDIAFVDIQLSDSDSFEIFRKHPVSFPVIFTTAYDKYLLESFEFNSIDYLLKPITEEKLKRSIEKVQKLEQHFIKGNLLKLVNTFQQTEVRSRIVARKGTDFITIHLENVAYFYTEHKVVFVRDHSGKQWIVDKTLGDWEIQLKGNNFFRLNRKYLVSAKAIERFKPDNGKIRVYLTPEVKEDVHVSKETAPAFKEWIGTGN
jgi:DNA-binding LytR/AlgR family response regulator